jgi:hypothetical protein
MLPVGYHPSLEDFAQKKAYKPGLQSCCFLSCGIDILNSGKSSSHLKFCARDMPGSQSGLINEPCSVCDRDARLVVERDARLHNGFDFFAIALSACNGAQEYLSPIPLALRFPQSGIMLAVLAPHRVQTNRMHRAIDENSTHPRG